MNEILWKETSSRSAIRISGWTLQLRDRGYVQKFKNLIIFYLQKNPLYSHTDKSLIIRNM